MSVFADTSALYALTVSNDEMHIEAGETWRGFLKQRVPLVTSNYVIVETCSLLQSRVGLGAVRSLIDEHLAVVRVLWVDVSMHSAGLEAVFEHSRRHLGLVDCTSFALMRQAGIEDVFAFDPHFAEQGFNVLPTG